MKGAYFHYSRDLAIILSEEDGRIGNTGQKALTGRSLSNRLAGMVFHFQWLNGHASNFRKSSSDIVSSVGFCCIFLFKHIETTADFLRCFL